MVYFPAPGTKKSVEAPHSGGIRTPEPNEETIQISFVRLRHVAKVKLYTSLLSIKTPDSTVFFRCNHHLLRKLAFDYSQINVQVDIVLDLTKTSG